MKVLVLVLLYIGTVTAAQADTLSPQDIKYLHDRFGVKQEEVLFSGMEEAERAALHTIIVDPWSRDYPFVRDARVQSKLTEIYSRECGAWARSHLDSGCPPTSSPDMQAGKIVADRQCNACHLFGTAETPPFFSMARTGTVSRTHLADALAAGHRMSPITLTPGEIDALLSYINGLK